MKKGYFKFDFSYLRMSRGGAPFGWDDKIGEKITIDIY